MTDAASEAAVLEAAIPSLEAEGYEVFLHPRQELLPYFMQGYSPDAIALKSGKNLAIEVIKEAVAKKENLERIRGLFSKQTEWELRVYFVRPNTTLADIDRSSVDKVQEALEVVEELLEKRMAVAALLQGWAVFEAVARMLVPLSFAKPQSPSRLLEVMGSTGHLTPSEADRLRKLVATRNRVAHGDLGADISYDQIRDLVSTTELLLEELAPSNANGL